MRRDKSMQATLSMHLDEELLEVLRLLGEGE